HPEEGSSDVGIERELAVAEFAEEVFADVRDGFEFDEAEKSAGAFDRMNRTEDAGERVSIAGIFFQLDQLAIQQIEVLVAFDQKLANDFIAHSKSCSKKRSKSGVACAACGQGPIRVAQCFRSVATIGLKMCNSPASKSQRHTVLRRRG